MDRAEKGALGVAAIGHVALFGLLSVGFLAAPNPELLKSQPIEVVLADEIGLTSAAPEISDEMPAERLAEIEGPVEPTPPPPAPELPAPPRPEVREAAPTRPTPVPRPTPPRREAARPTPPAARPTPPRDRTRPTGRLSGITDGLSDRASDSSSTRPKASQTAAQARRSITVAIGSEIRPYWRPPTGADADQLVTVIQFDLNRDGSLAGAPRVLEQRGTTESNAPQQALHAERAKRAIQAAAPFNLPSDYYDQWKTWRLEFDARLR